MMRTRQCNNPTPAYNGVGCVGKNTDVQVCQEQPCPSKFVFFLADFFYEFDSMDPMAEW